MPGADNVCWFQSRLLRFRQTFAFGGRHEKPRHERVVIILSLRDDVCATTRGSRRSRLTHDVEQAEKVVWVKFTGRYRPLTQR